MALTFPPLGTLVWMRRVEQALLQNHVDIQRLWGIVPQIPDQVPGIPFTGPLEPSWFVVPSSTSSQRSRSSHNSSTSPASSSSSSGPSSSAAGSGGSAAGSGGSSSSSSVSPWCQGECIWIYDPPRPATNGWEAGGNCTGTGDCLCTPPEGTGAYQGEVRYTECPNNPPAGSSSSGSSSSSSTANCGTCLITYIGGTWLTMANYCTSNELGTCICSHPSEASFEGDIRTTNCVNGEF